MKVRRRLGRLWTVVVPVLIAALIKIQIIGVPLSNWPFGDRPPRWWTDGAWSFAFSCIVAGIAIAVRYFETSRSRRNEVYGSTATEAATTSLHWCDAPPRTRYVSDAQLKAMAGTAFAPPDGVLAWQGNVLLTESITRRTLDSFVAELLTSGYLQIAEIGGDDVRPARALVAGPALAGAPTEVSEWIGRALGGDRRALLDRYDEDLAKHVSKLDQLFTTSMANSGWWQRRRGPAVMVANFGRATRFWKLLWIAAFVWVDFFILLVGAAVITNPLVWAIFIVATVRFHFAAFLVPNLSARTAEGSAVTLQVESFRRFLAASETPKVNDAWSREYLREYGAWAIAVGGAEAWRREVSRSYIMGIDLTAIATTGRDRVRRSSSDARSGAAVDAPRAR